MRHCRYETLIDAPVETVWAFHASVEALPLLTPPGRRVRIVGDELDVRDGALHRIQVRIGPVWLPWDARISEVDPPFSVSPTRPSDRRFDSGNIAIGSSR